jgi:hypothetical protein
MYKALPVQWLARKQLLQAWVILSARQDRWQSDTLRIDSYIFVLFQTVMRMGKK